MFYLSCRIFFLNILCSNWSLHSSLKFFLTIQLKILFYHSFFKFFLTILPYFSAFKVFPQFLPSNFSLPIFLQMIPSRSSSIFFPPYSSSLLSYSSLPFFSLHPYLLSSFKCSFARFFLSISSNSSFVFVFLQILPSLSSSSFDFLLQSLPLPASLRSFSVFPSSFPLLFFFVLLFRFLLLCLSRFFLCFYALQSYLSSLCSESVLFTFCKTERIFFF